MRVAVSLSLLALVGCASAGGDDDPDAAPGGDPDAAVQSPDAATSAPDAALATTDAAPPPRDAAPPPPDATPPPPDASTTGLTVPCANGDGFTMFRFHYDPSHGTSPVLDVWDATCSFSYAPDSICRIDAIGSIGTAAGGSALAFNGSDYLRVRFDANGLSFTQAAVYIQARSLSTSASTNFEVWSPLYGSVYGGPVDNDFVYDWYGADWTGYLYPSDSPSLTAIQIYPYTGSGNLGIAAVELCVQ